MEECGAPQGVDEHCLLSLREAPNRWQVSSCKPPGWRKNRGGFHCYRQVTAHGTYINRSFGLAPRDSYQCGEEWYFDHVL